MVYHSFVPKRHGFAVVFILYSTMEHQSICVMLCHENAVALVCFTLVIPWYLY